MTTRRQILILVGAAFLLYVAVLVWTGGGSFTPTTP